MVESVIIAQVSLFMKLYCNILPYFILSQTDCYHRISHSTSTAWKVLSECNNMYMYHGLMHYN